MKKCKSCQMEIDEKAKKCPHCQTDQRNWAARHPIWTTLIVLFLIGMVSSVVNGDKDKTTDNPAVVAESATAEATQAPTTPEVAETSEKAWVKVFEANGSANKQTESFTLKGGKQRVTYTFSGGSSIFGAIYVMTEGTSLEEQGGFPEVTVSQGGTDNTLIRKSAGTYYLDVKAANSTWKVTVEEEQ